MPTNLAGFDPLGVAIIVALIALSGLAIWAVIRWALAALRTKRQTDDMAGLANDEPTPSN